MNTLPLVSGPAGLADWAALVLHFGMLSLLAVGGALSTAPDMNRYLVLERHWLSDTQFHDAIALAQVAPGPNILFVALLGWQVGLNASTSLNAAHGTHAWISLLLATCGALLTLLGMLLPSSVLTYNATRWAHRHREQRGIRAFKAGFAPIVVALMLATAWLLSLGAHHDVVPLTHDLALWAISLVATWLLWRTRLHVLWLLGAGALLGAFWLG